MEIPDYLFHSIFGYDAGRGKEEIEWALGQIKIEGLQPLVAQAWANLVPEQIRDRPIIWLMEEVKSQKGQWLRIATQILDQSRLFRLDLDDRDWWVYQGSIPISAISILDHT